MLQNSKFRDLVDNVFSNIQCVEVSGQLNEIFSKSNTVNNLYKRGGKHNDTRLYKQFCRGNTLREIKSSEIKFNSKKNNYFEVITETIAPKSEFKEKENISEIDCKVKKIKDKPCIIKEYTANNLNTTINKLKELNKDYYTFSITKDGDYYSSAVFSYLSKVFNVAPETTKNEMLKDIKLDIITKFNKENYYKNYDYSIKHFKKSDADEKLSCNLPITSKMIKIYGDIFNINIVLINGDINEFVTKFNRNNATLVIEENSKNLVVLMTKQNFIRGEELVDILQIDKKYDQKELEKSKLDVLQNLAKMKNMNIRKAGKTGKINVKKEELITLICDN